MTVIAALDTYTATTPKTPIIIKSVVRRQQKFRVQNDRLHAMSGNLRSYRSFHLGGRASRESELCTAGLSVDSRHATCATFFLLNNARFRSRPELKRFSVCEPVWPSLAVRRYSGKRRDLGSNPLRLSFLFKRCGLWTLSCDFVPHN